MSKRQQIWNRLHEGMKEKRMRPNPARGKNKKSSAAPHELVVQRLASEADNKQTYRPVQPREFVRFPFEDLSLGNLKKACADHYNLPASTCDVLVSNRGPSCSNIEQIPHRKDKVYLVRFVVGQDSCGEDYFSSWNKEELDKSYSIPKSSDVASAAAEGRATAKPGANYGTFSMATEFPASVSIATLLEAGKLVRPTSKKKAVLTFEQFDITSKKWQDAVEVECTVDSKKFSSGGFRDAYH